MAIDVGDTSQSVAQDARDYSASAGANFPSVIATSAIFDGANIAYTPTTVIVNSSGKILYRRVGGQSAEQWINVIETLYAQL